MANYSNMYTEYNKDSGTDGIAIYLASKASIIDGNQFVYDNDTEESATIHRTYIEHRKIVQVGSGKWFGTKSLFKRICEKFKCSGLYVDYEPGNNFIIAIEYKDGKIKLEHADELTSEFAVDTIGIVNVCLEFQHIAEEIEDGTISKDSKDILNKIGISEQEFIKIIDNNV